MRVLALTTSSKNLADQVAPFLPNNTVVGFSLAGCTLEQSDDDSTYADFTVLAAGVPKEITLDKQYLRVKSSGAAQLLGN